MCEFVRSCRLPVSSHIYLIPASIQGLHLRPCPTKAWSTFLPQAWSRSSASNLGLTSSFCHVTLNTHFLCRRPAQFLRAHVFTARVGKKDEELVFVIIIFPHKTDRGEKFRVITSTIIIIIISIFIRIARPFFYWSARPHGILNYPRFFHASFLVPFYI